MCKTLGSNSSTVLRIKGFEEKCHLHVEDKAEAGTWHLEWPYNHRDGSFTCYVLISVMFCLQTTSSETQKKVKFIGKL